MQLQKAENKTKKVTWETVMKKNKKKLKKKKSSF